MSTNPQVHHGHALPSVFHFALPPFIYQTSYAILQLRACEQCLRLIRSHHTRTYGSTHDCARMREEE